MRQTGDTEDQAEGHRGGVDRVGEHAAWAHDLVADGVGIHRLGGEGFEAEAELGHGQARQGGATGQQQHGLDDLHPGGGDHAAEDHIDQHQGADHHHRGGVVEAEQQLDQLAGADHLHHQVAAHHGQRTEGGEGADLRLVEAVGDDIGEGEAAEVAQAFSHHKGDQRPADEERHGVDETVIALGKHQAGQAQQGGGGHIVAGNRQAVLEATDAATGGVKVSGGFGLACGPPGDGQGAENEDEEHADGMQVERLFFRRQQRCGDGGHGRQAQGGEAQGESAAHYFSSSSSCALSASNSVLAVRTYQPVSSQDTTMMDAATGMPTESMPPWLSGACSHCGANATTSMKL